MASERNSRTSARADAAAHSAAAGHAGSALDDAPEPLSHAELREIWPILLPADRMEAFRLLTRAEQEILLHELPARAESEVLLALAQEDQRLFIRMLPPDDTADLMQVVDHDDRERLLALLDEPARRELRSLLAYAEDEAGGLMNPRYARLRPDMTVDEAIAYLRRQTRERVATIYYVFVLDEGQHLMGVVSFRELFGAPPDKRVRDVMKPEVVTVRDDQDQESVSRVFAQHNLLAIPVVDADNRIKGVVTADDIVDVVQEEATEDAHKFGGMQALDEPYLATSFFQMVKKRGGWLAVLFLGEMLTATAMAYYQDALSHVVLSLFVPLIISSGGNSGSQASTLVIRAMALGEVKLSDWWRVMRREFAAGLVLGVILGAIGFLRIELWANISSTLLYTDHHLLVAFTVAVSLVGVVMFGTLAGSLLPFVLRLCRLDPASASAPFVATLVDVTGLVIYFTAATVILSGTLL
jgi:magnesium transporter